MNPAPQVIAIWAQASMSVLNSPENRDLPPHQCLCPQLPPPAIVSALENDAAGNPYRIFFFFLSFPLLGLAYTHLCSAISEKSSI